MKNVLSKQKRNYLHLSKDIEITTAVGSRRGDAIILKIHALEMYNDVHKFFISKNDIYLINLIPPKYIEMYY